MSVPLTYELHLNSAVGAKSTQSYLVSLTDLAACGLNQNDPVIDYLQGSKKAIMELIFNPL